jgi:CheY-like chemotaxis protein
MIFIIDDDRVMAECVAKACKKETQIFSNVIEAMGKITDGTLPDLIFLDVLLDGPDAFTFLNEMMTYSDTAKIPVVIVSSLKFKLENLQEYNVVGVLNKDTMVPQEIRSYVEKYAG